MIEKLTEMLNKQINTSSGKVEVIKTGFLSVGGFLVEVIEDRLVSVTYASDFLNICVQVDNEEELLATMKNITEFSKDVYKWKSENSNVTDEEALTMLFKEAKASK